jgi:hypothetical protein
MAGQAWTWADNEGASDCDCKDGRYYAVQITNVQAGTTTFQGHIDVREDGRRYEWYVYADQEIFSCAEGNVPTLEKARAACDTWLRVALAAIARQPTG